MIHVLHLRRRAEGRPSPHLRLLLAVAAAGLLAGTLLLVLR